jgi:histidyl-tRNA synthetase
MFQPARGTRDILPEEMLKRNWVQDNIRVVFEDYGYMPLGTPAFESGELLRLKSGEDVAEMIYVFKDKSDRELGLRFEWTTSLARVVASHRELPKPFKRYVIGPVWRYERPSEMNRREFWQMDVDIVGVSDPVADAEVLAVGVNCLKRIGIQSFIVRLNDRRLLEALIAVARMPAERNLDVIRAIDKRKKIGDEGVIDELTKLGASEESSQRLLDLTTVKGDPEEILKETRERVKDYPIGIEACDALEAIVEYSDAFGIRPYIIVDLGLARGLDYYTGPIFEVYAEGYESAGSIAGGGRYDTLVELVGGEPTPMTGISMGIHRLVLLMEKIGVFEGLELGPKVFIVFASKDVKGDAIRIAQDLRRAGVKTEMELLDRGLRKQLDIANRKGFRKVVIVGKRELDEGCVSVRDMDTSDQRKVKTENLAEEF